jgi:hypothetical protein
MGDVGYINRWTMEITNNSRYYSIPLVVGRRIAQIVFFDTIGTIQGRSYEQVGKYQAPMIFYLIVMDTSIRIYPNQLHSLFYPTIAIEQLLRGALLRMRACNSLKKLQARCV